MVGMEGAALSAMLNILVHKFAPLLIKQYSSIVGVAKDLQDLQNLVQEIECWLEKAGYEAKGSDQLFNWLRQLKNVVDDTCDIVDDFRLEAEKHETNGGNHIVSKWLITKPKSFLFQSKAALKIKAIKDRFDAIVKRRTAFSAIINCLPDGHPVSHINRTSRAIPTLPIVDEESVRGREQEKHEIISELVDKNSQQIVKIVSIIGLGGSGKTTLAKLVFNDGNIIKDYFEVQIWVHVSQEFDVQKLVEKLFEAISAEKSERHTLLQMTNTISDKLTGKRYLLVLDDVWTEDRIQWKEFMVHIKSGAPGSSILLTTRSQKVAEAVESTNLVNLQFLSEVDSWAVFTQSFGTAIEDLDSEFLEVGREIVNKCGGVPLAIKVFSGVLRDKRRVEQWKAMRDSNLLDDEDKEHRVSACLQLSYFHLPSHLKQCFRICSVFPKGHRIYKEQLISRWIAHDMVGLTHGVDYLEDVGDDHFNSLVQVSFLQEVDEEDGRVICKMHDLVHDLAQSTMHGEISTSVAENATSSTKGYRYISLVEQPKKPLPKEVFKNARDIYVDNGRDIIFGNALGKAKRLRSITVNFNCSEALLMSIVHVKNLHYLEMNMFLSKTLPEAISDICSLQTLHLTNSGLLELPNSIGKLQKLRTLNLSNSTELKCLPDSIGECNMLSSIDLYCCHELTALPNSIDRNENLRVLRLGYTKIEKLPSSITTLRNLEHLDLRGCLVLVELPEGIGNLERLQVLNIEDCVKLEGLPRGLRQLSQVKELALFVVGEGEKFARISELANIGRNTEDLTIRDIFHVMEPHDAHRACLKQKTKLQRLNLRWYPSNMSEVNPELEKAVLDGLEPSPKIKELKIHGYSGRQYATWMLNQVGGGAHGFAHFPFLRVMTLYDLPNLKHLHGLVELPCLEELRIWKMPSLESISGGPFSSLVKLIMGGLPSLGDVWMVAERTMSDGEEGGSCSTPHLEQEFRVGNCLSCLSVEGCPKLKVRPYLPVSLQQLDLYSGNEQLLELAGQYQGYSSSFSFSHLKKLNLGWIARLESGPNMQFAGLGSVCRWDLLQHMTALESLNITGIDGQTELPESLGSLCSLQTLNIHSCLPQSMGRLTSLKVLRIESCPELHQLPECLGGLCSLQTLVVRSLRNINCFPRSLHHLTSLQDLTIAGCDALHELPESIGDLCSLCKLCIYSLPRLACFPESICRLTSLEELRISDCPGLTSLPQGMKSLSSLEYLEVDQCSGIISLPEGIGGLTSLKTPEIFECAEIISLPKGIGGLTSLQKLQISGCPGIRSLPEGIKGLADLQTLEISSCPGIESLPESIRGLTALMELDIWDCPGIKSFPEGIKDLTALKRLCIGDCTGFESLPEGIKRLTALKILNIVTCPVIKSLPEGIKCLTALEQLLIIGCPDLARRCKEGKGEDWHLISHIPRVLILEANTSPPPSPPSSPRRRCLALPSHVVAAVRRRLGCGSPSTNISPSGTR